MRKIPGSRRMAVEGAGRVDAREPGAAGRLRDRDDVFDDLLAACKIAFGYGVGRMPVQYVKQVEAAIQKAEAAS